MSRKSYIELDYGLNWIEELELEESFAENQLPRHPEPPPDMARCNRCNRLHLKGVDCVCWTHPNRAAR